MGNVNGKGEEDGANSPSGSGGGGVGVRVDEKGGAGGGGGGGGVGNKGSVAPDKARLGHLPPPPPELMGQSPPQSPRATQLPLLFTPQVPVVPLQRPDEIQIPSNSWMQTTVGCEEICNEQGIPTMITWSYGGNEVAVEGSWDNWKTRIPLQRSVEDYVPEDLESMSSFEPPHSPESSYNNLQLGNEDFAKDPPLVPPNLQMTLLNMPSSYMEIPPLLSRPQHVVLNHLYVQKGKGGPAAVALGSTHRFSAKYVTVVLYKSLQR